MAVKFPLTGTPRVLPYDLLICLTKHMGANASSKIVSVADTAKSCTKKETQWKKFLVGLSNRDIWVSTKQVGYSCIT